MIIIANRNAARKKGRCGGWEGKRRVAGVPDFSKKTCGRKEKDTRHESTFLSVLSHPQNTVNSSESLLKVTTNLNADVRDLLPRFFKLSLHKRFFFALKYVSYEY